MRVAAIDIGTNTVLLLVADSGVGFSLRPAVERATITRLGEGVDRTRTLSPAAVARTLECLEAYSRDVRELRADRVAVVGTSAMRDARGGDELRSRIKSLFGVEISVLSGDEEARLTFCGATSGLAIDPPADVAVFDIGGGSTEVVVGRVGSGMPRIDFARSYDAGSVRLTERLLTHDPPSKEDADVLARTARATFADVPPLSSPEPPIGIAGTMTTLAAVSLGLETYDAARVHGHLMLVEELRRLVDHLTSVSVEARKRIPGMEPKRADVIVAGGVLALALLDRWGVSAVRISDRGVRWGIAEQLARSS
jgi:exopolyphosphatase/guanosine-5'-triphosphate,3'-diphosphate pyrophosphatase